MLKYGDIFNWQGKDYIYLAASNTTLYAAKILDQSQSEQLTKMYQSRVAGNKNLKLQSTIYLYVALTTDDYKQRLAHLNKTDHEFFPGIIDQNHSLNLADKLQIKREILDTNSSLPKELKKLIQELE